MASIYESFSIQSLNERAPHLKILLVNFKVEKTKS